MDRTEIIFETPSIVEFQIRVKKVNKTRSLVGSITFHEPFGNNIKVEGKALKKQGKGNFDSAIVLALKLWITCQ